MSRAGRSTSIINRPPFATDANVVHSLIDILTQQPLTRNRYTNVLLNNWAKFCERAGSAQNISRPEINGQRKRMLVICVSTYIAHDLKELEGPKTDWKLWLMLGLMAGWNVEVLADTVLNSDPTRYPTKDNIQRFARSLLKGNSSGDQFIVAHSGHCDAPGLILEDNSYISHQELRDWFAKPLVTGSRLWSFFDCCESSNLLKLPQKIFLGENKSIIYQSSSREARSRDREVQGTVISIGSAAGKSGELSLNDPAMPSEVLLCGPLAFASYSFFHSACKSGEPLLASFLPHLMKFLPSQEAQLTSSAVLERPVLPILRALS